MNKIRYVSSKKRYYVHTGKVHKTDLSGAVVMVEGDSHEDAVSRYLNRAVK